MPVGMADRVICAESGSPARLHWLSRTRDYEDPGTEWIVAAGPGAAGLSSADPLGRLAPFSDPSVIPALASAKTGMITNATQG